MMSSPIQYKKSAIHLNPNETREQYLRRAGKLARKLVNTYRNHDNYRDKHKSHLIHDVLVFVAKLFVDLKTYGVEHCCYDNTRMWDHADESFYYLNVGDPYTKTLIHVHNRFTVTSWGSLVEKWQLDV